MRKTYNSSSVITFIGTQNVSGKFTNIKLMVKILSVPSLLVINVSNIIYITNKNSVCSFLNSKVLRLIDWV